MYTILGSVAWKTNVELELLGEIQGPRKSVHSCMHSFICSTNIYPVLNPVHIWEQFLPSTEMSGSRVQGGWGPLGSGQLCPTVRRGRIHKTNREHLAPPT